MTERLGIVASLQLVTTASDFDRRLELEPSLRDEVAGVTTVSLFHIYQGITPEGYSLPAYSDYGTDRLATYVDLNPGVYREVFGTDPLYAYKRTEELIKDNRNYGVSGATTEYIMEQSYAPSIYHPAAEISGYIAYMFKQSISIPIPELKRKKLSDIKGYEDFCSTNKGSGEVVSNREHLIEILISLRQRGGGSNDFWWEKRVCKLFKSK